MSEYVIGNVFESNVIGVYRYELLVSCAKEYLAFLQVGAEYSVHSDFRTFLIRKVLTRTD